MVDAGAAATAGVLAGDLSILAGDLSFLEGDLSFLAGGLSFLAGDFFSSTPFSSGAFLELLLSGTAWLWLGFFSGVWGSGTALLASTSSCSSFGGDFFAGLEETFSFLGLLVLFAGLSGVLAGLFSDFCGLSGFFSGLSGLLAAFLSGLLAFFPGLPSCSLLSAMLVLMAILRDCLVTLLFSSEDEEDAAMSASETVLLLSFSLAASEDPFSGEAMAATADLVLVLPEETLTGIMDLFLEAAGFSFSGSAASSALFSASSSFSSATTSSSASSPLLRRSSPSTSPSSASFPSSSSFSTGSSTSAAPSLPGSFASSSASSSSVTASSCSFNPDDLLRGFLASTSSSSAAFSSASSSSSSVAIKGMAAAGVFLALENLGDFPGVAFLADDLGVVLAESDLVLLAELLGVAAAAALFAGVASSVCDLVRRRVAGGLVSSAFLAGDSFLGVDLGEPDLVLLAAGEGAAAASSAAAAVSERDLLLEGVRGAPLATAFFSREAEDSGDGIFSSSAAVSF